MHGCLKSCSFHFCMFEIVHNEKNIFLLKKKMRIAAEPQIYFSLFSKVMIRLQRMDVAAR